MNELIDYTLIENEILKDSISDFLSEIREKSPNTSIPWCEKQYCTVAMQKCLYY